MKKIVFALALLFTAMSTQAQQKIGYFDVNYVLPQLPEAKAANADLSNYTKKLQEDMANRERDLMGKLEKYQKEAATMPDPTRVAFEKEIRALQEQLQEFQGNAEQSIQKKQNDLMSPILAKVEKTLKDVAKENGYTFILNKQALLFEPEDKEFDISDLVLKKLGVTPATKPADKK
jgi:outer membrane protein